MIKACVIGHPISHSLSPTIHTYWLEELNIDGKYEVVDVSPEKLDDFVAKAKLELAGFNVTIPHKESIMKYCDELSEQARDVGAVNTVVIKSDGTVFGDNTDVFGFSECLKKNVKKINRTSAVIIGAGGASRAGIVAFKKMSFAKITVVNRTYLKAKKLAEEFKIESASLYNIETVLGDASIVVNTSPAGMNGENQLKLPLENLSKNAIVYDIVYKPLSTSLLEDASYYGIETVQGIDMLLYQAVAGFKYWFGKTPVVSDALRKKVLG